MVYSGASQSAVPGPAAAAALGPREKHRFLGPCPRAAEAKVNRRLFPKPSRGSDAGSLENPCPRSCLWE